MTFIDTHAHLDLCGQSIEQLIENANIAGVEHIIQIATDFEGSKTALDLSHNHSQISATAGIHPLYSQGFQDIDSLEEWARDYSDDIVAIGEAGLDYKYDDVDKAEQHVVFERQLQLAESLQKPIVIHNRLADEDTISMMNNFPNVSMVLHCFMGSMSFLEKITVEDLMISFTGIITRHDKGKLVQVIKEWPLDKIMIETDCPYLTPKEHSGQENQPAFVPAVAEKIAIEKDLSIAEVAEASTQNAINFFGLDI